MASTLALSCSSVGAWEELLVLLLLFPLGLSDWLGPRPHVGAGRP